MKSLMLLWERIADESAIRCCTSTTMDISTVHRRMRHEGISFLTISLPNFGKDFERSLDQGYVDRRLFQGFAWKAGLPVFLGGFLGLVFHRDSGVLVDAPNIEAILAIRQLTLMFGKISLKASDRRIRKAMKGYIDCEQEVRAANSNRNLRDIEDFGRISRLLFAPSLTWADQQIYYGEAVPKHGPGATADRLRGNGKYRQTTWPSRLEEIFPSGEFLLANWSYHDQLESVDFLEPEAEIPVRVISVPKTLKTPRIIGIEPTAMQYAQQAILPILLEGLLKQGWQKCPTLLQSFLGFDDQTPNQRMAKEGSLLGELATLDLSEASDRVSNELVREMLSDHPHLLRAVEATRSQKAHVPGHGVIHLSKFASMGSALCFPVEAMVFLTMIFVGIEKELNTRLTLKDVLSLKRQVRVYGDDIIVPVNFVRPVVTSLERFGAKVNVRKSFWNGKFRESCGKEYYDGEDVSIVRVREVFPTRLEHAEQVISMVSLRNQLYYAGYWSTVGWLDKRISKLLRGNFPTVLPTSPVLGRHSFLGYETKELHPTLHSPLVRGYVVSAKIPSDPLDDTGALLKFFLKRGVEPSYDEKHLLRAGRPLAVNIKLRKASAV